MQKPTSLKPKKTRIKKVIEAGEEPFDKSQDKKIVEKESKTQIKEEEIDKKIEELLGD